MVKKDSITIDKDKINFVITDFKNEVNVVYKGAVPSLFLEEKGVIAEGILEDNNFFVAKKILAKHDENYMPPELKDLKKMISFFGNSLIFLSIVITITIIYFSFQEVKNLNLIYPNKIRTFVLSQVTLVLMSFFTLMSAYVVSDFSLINVYQNSHSSKPLFYKISGVWGNHEGSLLLWINILVLFSFIFYVLNYKHQKNFKLYTLIAQNFLVLGFLIFLFVTSNPFSLIYPTPMDGLGLNPVLQDPALAIHPPLLYVGFVGSSIFFSAALASLLSGVKGEEFAKSIKFWVLLTWIFQTLGILVGSVWAYYELGWGGFWFWDPVENASLLPWFAMTALMHSIILLEKKKSLIQLGNFFMLINI